MKEDKHIGFIRELAGELEPVQVQWSAEKRALVFLFIHVLGMLALMRLTQSFSWPSGDEFLIWSWLGLQVTFFFLTMASFVYVCFLSLVPGALAPSFFKSVAFLGGFFALFCLLQVFVETPKLPSQMRAFCEIKLFFLALIPLGHFFFLIRRGSFHHRKLTMLCAGLGAGLIPAFVMHLACSREPFHVVMFHLLPVLGLVGLIFLVSRFKKIKQFFA